MLVSSFTLISTDQKTSLWNCIGLKVHFSFFDMCMFHTFCFTEHSASDAREACRIHAGVNGKCLLGLLNFKQIWITLRYFSKDQKHLLSLKCIHQFSSSDMKTDEQNGMTELKDAFS